MHAQFRIDGQALMAMDNAEADAAFNEAVSLLVNCEDQAEIDRLWSALSAVPAAEACGWLKDRFGVSWQIAPRALGEMMASGDRGRGRAPHRRLHGDEEARPRRARARLRRQRDRALLTGSGYAAPPEAREKTMPEDVKIDARTMRGVIPYIGMNGRAGEAADFYARAFAARDLGRMPARRTRPAHALPGRGQRRRADDDRHARPASRREPQGFHLQLVVDDGDLWWNRAVEAGCTVAVPFEKMFWGDRWGMLADPSA